MAGQAGEASRQRLARHGLRALTDHDGLALLDAAIRPATAVKPAACASAATAGPVPGPPLQVPVRLALAALRQHAGQLPPLLSRLVRVTGQGPGRPGAGGAAAASPAASLAALPPAERSAALRGLVRTQVAAVLGLAGPDAVEPGRTFRAIGFTSLAAIELRNQLGYRTGLTLAASLAYDYPTPDALADYLAAKLSGGPAADRAALAELANLEALLGTVATDSAARSRIITRLEGITADLRAGIGQSAADHRDLADATDDEIFSLIDKELGV
jgi:acyl carrier protein